ncbi:MAG TPA: hypothetical protein PLR44_12355 [Thermomicrobiales bacterium]|jgi:hypothetical protein|nr:hypothetical protein [Chloroflexota bacterium]HBY47667.1 hypothetical protein [Chloroflexota bacterium]HCG30028.1 hypothetical protein [Chloroflexota bacterium]HQZ90834.1 hypothetical protein [Thermomicrobiales bacterium]HRA32570.1 hypothetical protein [Thermomicrobiales bacterium]
MNEIFPVLAGVLVGIIAMRIASLRVRTAAIILLSVVFGIAASAISGELALTWEFVLVDIPLVAISSLVTVFVVRRIFSANVAHR